MDKTDINSNSETTWSQFYTKGWTTVLYTKVQINNKCSCLKFSGSDGALIINSGNGGVGGCGVSRQSARGTLGAPGRRSPSSGSTLRVLANGALPVDITTLGRAPLIRRD